LAMKRREFITVVGGAAATWPLAALGPAKKKRVYRIGYLSAPQSGHRVQRTLDAFSCESCVSLVG